VIWRNRENYRVAGGDFRGAGRHPVRMVGETLLLLPIITGILPQVCIPNKKNLSLFLPTNSIQFSLFCTARYKKLQIPLRGLYNLYTYDYPDLWPQEKLPIIKNNKNFHRGKKVRNLQESNRGGSLSRMDGINRRHVYNRMVISIKY